MNQKISFQEIMSKQQKLYNIIPMTGFILTQKNSLTKNLDLQAAMNFCPLSVSFQRTNDFFSQEIEVRDPAHLFYCHLLPKFKYWNGWFTFGSNSNYEINLTPNQYFIFSLKAPFSNPFSPDFSFNCRFPYFDIITRFKYHSSFIYDFLLNFGTYKVQKITVNNKETKNIYSDTLGIHINPYDNFSYTLMFSSIRPKYQLQIATISQKEHLYVLRYQRRFLTKKNEKWAVGFSYQLRQSEYFSSQSLNISWKAKIHEYKIRSNISTHKTVKSAFEVPLHENCIFKTYIELRHEAHDYIMGYSLNFT